MSEGGKDRIEIVCFEVNTETIARDEHSRTFYGSEIQVVGTEIRTARELSERLRRVTHKHLPHTRNQYKIVSPEPLFGLLTHIHTQTR